MFSRVRVIDLGYGRSCPEGRPGPSMPFFPWLRKGSVSLQVDTSQIRPDVADMLAIRDYRADIQLHSTVDDVQPRLLLLRNLLRGHRGLGLVKVRRKFSHADRTCPGPVLRRLNAVAFQGFMFRTSDDSLIQGMKIPFHPVLLRTLPVALLCAGPDQVPCLRVHFHVSVDLKCHFSI